MTSDELMEHAEKLIKELKQEVNDLKKEVDRLQPYETYYHMSYDMRHGHMVYDPKDHEDQ